MVKNIAYILVMLVVATGCAKPPVTAEKKHSFEGVIEYQVTYNDTIDAEAEGLPTRMFANIRKDKMLMAFKLGAKKFKVITDLNTKGITSIFYHNSRFYATIHDSSSKTVRDIPKLTVAKTDKLKKIAGHRCIKSQVAENYYGEQIKFDIYYTPALAYENYYWSYGFNDVNGILLKYTIFDFGMPAELEAIAVTPKNLDPYLFSLPPGTIVTH